MYVCRYMYVCVYAYISLAFYLKSLVIRQWHYVCDVMFIVINKKFVTKKKYGHGWAGAFGGASAVAGGLSI